MKYSYRQNLILLFIRKNQPIGNKEILEHIIGKVGELDRVTIVRDLEKLRQDGFIVKIGQGRNTKYKAKEDNRLLMHYNMEEYFRESPDARIIISDKFNFGIFDYFSGTLYSKQEIRSLEVLNSKYLNRMKKISPTILKKEIERLTIELSWKSSQIEGNTYSLIDTEILIKESKLAKNHSKEEAQMILNHKTAIDYIFKNKKQFKKISSADIENIHELLSKKMGIRRGIRKGLVGITGTRYMPLDNQYQIKEALQNMIKILNDTNKPVLERALSAILLISYIQPFEDGNKRTARLLGNAILLANEYCPLSFRSVDDGDYKKAILLFYEQNSALFFKQLFTEQFIFSLNNYFLVKN